MSYGVAAWSAMVAAAVLVGVAKTGIGGVGPVAAALFAVALPARESTGALLPLLVCGDVVAVALYRRHAHVPTVLRLLVGVAPGILLGFWFLAVADDTVIRRTIGLAILALVGVQLLSRRHPPVTGGAEPAHGASELAVTGAAGVAAGFATMTANAAGPVTSIYLLRAGLGVREIVGTGAWFYLVVNLVKLPFSAGLSLITPSRLLLDLVLVPAMLLGAVVGVRIIRRIDRSRFELVILVLSVGAAVLLLL